MHGVPPRQVKAASRSAIVLTISLYALWGMIHNLNDVLIAQFKSAFALSDLQSSLVQSCFYVAYLIMPIPVALFLSRFGYKRGIIVGLVLPALGFLLFLPAANAVSYPAFLGALFVVACGMTFLETSGTGVIVVLGEPERAEWRINLAQAFNPVGSITGILIGSFLIFSDKATGAADSLSDAARYASVQAVKAPYVGIAAAFLSVALLVKLTRFPDEAMQGSDESGDGVAATFDGFRTLLRSGTFRFAVIAQFFYVGTQIGVWSFLIRYAQHAIPGITLRQAGLCLSVSLGCFLIGRFFTLVLLRRYSSAQICRTYAAIAAALTLTGIALPGPVGLVALVTTSLFMSIMYPGLYAIGLHGNQANSKPASALMIMAIVGGAVLTAAMGAISDASTIATAYVVPLTGFLVVFACGNYAVRKGIVGPATMAGH
ncbi:MAG: L-fucose:H+ symporter permease [Sphingomonadales bacterium]|nr:L-fucose:H+ symporter permease [Sphingomonadales bacterium]